ncbi:MAG: hypothetical protein PHH00_03235 [Candidatus Nanoarchaeia archaeon]|nr:hypothetical protein [Candidatus Nanoarchaeia archaeon]
METQTGRSGQEYWHELTEDEKRVIDEKDRVRCSVIKGIPPVVRSQLYHDLIDLPKNKQYFLEQAAWLKKEIDLANKREGRDVSNEVIASLMTDPSCEEFRIDYAVRHPDEVKQPWPEEFSGLIRQIEKAYEAKPAVN